MTKKYLCVVLHHGASGKRFAEELLRRFQRRYGQNVPVVIDMSSFVEDKYDSLINYLKDTRYCLVAINQEFLEDEWQQYCCRQAQHYSMQRDLSLVPVGIDNHKTFTGFWAIYSPVVFGSNFSTEDYHFDLIVDAIRPEEPTELSNMAVEENLPPSSQAEIEKWRVLLMSCRSIIEDGVDPINFVNTLYSQSAITASQKESIQAERTRHSKTAKVLDSVMENGVLPMQQFIMSLRHCHKHLYTKLVDEYIRPNGLSFTLATTQTRRPPAGGGDDQWQDLLVCCFDLLVEAVDPVNIIDKLVSMSVLSMEQTELIAQEATRRAKMVKLLDYIRMNGPEAIQMFIISLQTNESSVYKQIEDQYLTPAGVHLARGSTSRHITHVEPHVTLPTVPPTERKKPTPASPGQPVQESQPPSFIQYRGDQKRDLFVRGKSGQSFTH